MPNYATGRAQPDYVPSSPQEALFAQLLGQGVDRRQAALASGNQYFSANPFLAAITAPRGREDGSTTGLPFPLPSLGPNANDVDRQLYQQLQPLAASAATGTEPGIEGLYEQFVYRGPELPAYGDPALRTFVENLKYNTTLTDQFSFLGDNFFPAVGLLGLAAGGAAAAGGFSGAGAPAAAGTSGSLVPAGSYVTGAAATPALGADIGALSAGGLGGTAGATGGLGAAGLGSTITTNTGYAGALPSGGTLAATGGTSAGGPAVPAFSGLSALDIAKLGTAGLSAGQSLASLFGGPSGAEQNASVQNDIAKQLFDQSSPLRGQSLQQLLGFLQTGQIPQSLQVGLDQIYTQGREGLESQYNVARENILGRTPSRGGQLNALLADLEGSRASQVGRLGADLTAQYEYPLRTNLFSAATGLGTNQGSLALQGLGQAGNALSGAEARQSADTLAQGQSLGSLLALLFQPSAPQQTGSGPSLFEKIVGR